MFLASTAKQLFEVRGNCIYNLNTTVINEKKKKYSGKDEGRKDTQADCEVSMSPELRNMVNKGCWLIDSRKTANFSLFSHFAI